MKNIRELIVDSFAGGGGASTGIEQAIGKAIDIAINHDPAAIYYPSFSQTGIRRAQRSKGERRTRTGFASNCCRQ